MLNTEVNHALMQRLCEWNLWVLQPNLNFWTLKGCLTKKWSCGVIELSILTLLKHKKGTYLCFKISGEEYLIISVGKFLGTKFLTGNSRQFSRNGNPTRELSAIWILGTQYIIFSPSPNFWDDKCFIILRKRKNRFAVKSCVLIYKKNTETRYFFNFPML